MPLYEHAVCPVCQNELAAGEDIVYCPECGTPHHRACWQTVGHCANQARHGEGYDYYTDYQAQYADPIPQPREAETAVGGFYMPQGDSQNASRHNAEGAPVAFPVAPVPVDESRAYENDKQTIGGESVADCAAVIRTNVARFINLFKRFEGGKKTSWNWGAFFFGPYYLLFRKIYMQGVLFLCIMEGSSFLGSMALARFAPQFTKALSDMSAAFAKGSVSQEAMARLQAVSDFSTASRIFGIMTLVALVIRIIIALYADYFYEKAVLSVVKGVKQQLDEGYSLVQNPLFGAPSEELNNEQMKRLYLSRRGGTSIFIPLIAYFAMNIISSIF